MDSFVQLLGGSIRGILSGFDRLRLRGTKRLLASTRGLVSYLWKRRILWKDFPDHAEAETQAQREATQAQTGAAARPPVCVTFANREKQTFDIQTRKQ